MNRLLLCALCIVGWCHRATSQQHENFRYNPRTYIVQRVLSTITVDGQINEDSWQKAAWTQEFIDIEGTAGPAPLYATRAKMLWDDNYFYISAEMIEPHIWATYTKRDAVIYHEHDFEVFIDPDGDTHNYYELEINALETIWDLLLLKPYRDGGPAINGWDIAGLKSAVHVRGTLNDPSDVDDRWFVELAIPWAILREAAPNNKIPENGDQWRINFSRVNWQVEPVNGEYQKIINPKTGKSFPEFNWVWSDQGKISMHQPETWGFVQFSDTKAGSAIPPFNKNPADEIKWRLRQLYYAQRLYYEREGKYTDRLERLGLKDHVRTQLTPYTNIETTFDAYVARYEGHGLVVEIDQSGNVRKLNSK